MSTARILVVDDESDIRDLVQEILSEEGYTVETAASAAEARAACAKHAPDLVLLDIWMPDSDGISLLREWQLAQSFTAPIVMMSGHGTVETAVEATRLGAVDYVEKPLSLAKLLRTVQRALDDGRRRRHSARTLVPPLLAPIGRSQLMRELREKGTTLLFVSHDMSVVRDLCQRAVYLNKGKLLYLGSSAQAIRYYFQGDGDKHSTDSKIAPPTYGSGKSEVLGRFGSLACWISGSSEDGVDKGAHLLGVALLDEWRRPTSKVVMGKDLILWVIFEDMAREPIDVSVAIKNRYDQVVSSFGSYTLGLAVRKPPANEVSFVKFKMSAMIEAGLHPATGGNGMLACSGDLLLEALVACAGVTLRAVAMPKYCLPGLCCPFTAITNLLTRPWKTF
jgi:DNA-binding response OmpR family regulator